MFTTKMANIGTDFIGASCKEFLSGHFKPKVFFGFT
jgi:hypothetical protein